MRNLATPIKEKRASHARQVALQQVTAAPSISESEKKDRIASIEAEAEKIRVAYVEARDKIAAGEAEDKETLQRQLSEDVDAALNQQAARMQAAQDMLTHEEKQAHIDGIKKQEEEFQNAYGLQPFTKEDENQKKADEIARDDYVKNQEYKDIRREGYPLISDQLDAIMKWAATAPASAAITPELKAIATACMAVKDANPKPGSATK